MVVLAMDLTFLLLFSVAILKMSQQHKYPTNLADGLPGMEVEQELILAQPSWTVLYERLSGL